MRSILALKQAGFVCMMALLATACQKEISDEDGSTGGPNPTPTDCRVSKIVYYDSTGAVDDTAGFTYTNDKITHVATKTYSIDLVYKDNRVSRINYFDGANAPYDFYDSVTYNAAGKIESLTFYNAAPLMPTGGYVLSYNADGTPAKLVERTQGQGGTLEDSYEYVYTWNNQNITSMTIRDLVLATNYPPLSFTYDNNSNYFKGFPEEFIFADNRLMGISGFEFGYFSPFFFSKNNVASISGTPVTYQKDASQRFSGFTVGSIRASSYEYECN